MEYYLPVNSETIHPPTPLPCANPGAFDFFEKFWAYSALCCQLRRSNPVPLELQRGSNRLFKCTYPAINNWLLFGLTIDQPWLLCGTHLLMEKKIIQRILYEAKTSAKRKRSFKYIIINLRYHSWKAAFCYVMQS